jgi:signal transduction histidine kinase
VKATRQIALGNFDVNLAMDSNDEIGLLGRAFEQMARELQVLQGKIAQNATLVAMGSIAAQVAHDIRSPLAALDSVAKDTAPLPEEKRIIVRSAVSRIRDIANQLIEKTRKSQGDVGGAIAPITPFFSTVESESIELISSLIDLLLTEKRLQFRSKFGIRIEDKLDASSYGLFAKIQPTGFKTALSNLVNNAVEALDEKGEVEVYLTAEGADITIRVQDNGAGISSEILARLGRLGETHGKVGGSGLGLYFARANVESWGGRLDIQSEIGKGTAVIIRLPQAPAPEWFVSKLELGKGFTIIILDDDPSIHHVWQGRFNSIRVKEQKIKVLHFSNPHELRDWVERNKIKAQRTLYLTDYELLGHKETGLSLIEELGLGERSILVTSRYEEKGILDQCLRLKIRVIPKGLAAFVPIGFRMRVTKDHPDAVLIDDDQLIRKVWSMKAKEKSKTLLTFSTPTEFLATADRLDRKTPIYLDAKLGEDINGEEFAQTIYSQGFVNIYLATGHRKESFRTMPWIKEIRGKEPPWS